MNKEANRHPEYYEAILQIRPARDDVLGFVEQLVNARNDTQISKVMELKTGYDVYLSNQRFARGALVGQLRKKFREGKITITKALYGQHKMSSKLVYRATVLFRFG